MARAGKILLVEDERIIAMDVRARLEALGYDVPEIVSSGEDAVRAARMHRPDLVLMDIFIRGEMDGIEAATRVRSELGTPVIFLSAYADQKVVQRAMESDPFGYFINLSTKGRSSWASKWPSAGIVTRRRSGRRLRQARQGFRYNSWGSLTMFLSVLKYPKRGQRPNLKIIVNGALEHRGKLNGIIWHMDIGLPPMEWGG